MISNRHFDKKYFTGYYTEYVGSFSPADLRRNRNWFHGWFKALNRFYDFEHGNSKKVLEIGCAIGAASSILQERGFDVTATDISPYAVKKAQSLLPGLRIEKLDILSNRLPRKKYDLIIAFEVIEHLTDPERALRNMRALLAKGGSLIVSTPYPYGYVYRDVTHISVKHPFDWLRIFRNAGFSDVKYQKLSFIPFFNRISKHFHWYFPFIFDTRYINSTVFFHAKNS